MVLGLRSQWYGCENPGCTPPSKFVGVSPRPSYNPTYHVNSLAVYYQKSSRATTNVQKNKSYVGLFISYVGLFIFYVGLFISYVGLIKSYVGLFNSYVGDKIS